MPILGCARCGGIWFTRGELEKLAREEPDQMDYLDSTVPRVQTCHPRSDRFCPTCRVLMAVVDIPTLGRGLPANGCPQCQGLWLEHGELTAIHANVSSRHSPTPPAASGTNHCPYCRASISTGHPYCPTCLGCLTDPAEPLQPPDLDPAQFKPLPTYLTAINTGMSPAWIQSLQRKAEEMAFHYYDSTTELMTRFRYMDTLFERPSVPSFEPGLRWRAVLVLGRKTSHEEMYAFAPWWEYSGQPSHSYPEYLQCAALLVRYGEHFPSTVIEPKFWNLVKRLFFGTKPERFALREQVEQGYKQRSEDPAFLIRLLTPAFCGKILESQNCGIQIAGDTIAVRVVDRRLGADPADDYHRVPQLARETLLAARAAAAIA